MRCVIRMGGRLRWAAFPVRLKHKLSGSSHAWMQRHTKDPYVRASREQDLRSRAAFKLKEILDKHKFIRAGHSVLDLGATPGGWSEVAAGLVGLQGRVIAVDLKDMVPLKDVTFLRGDFTEASTQEALLRALEPASQFDILLSDMAPNFSGDQQTDHLRSMNLCSEVLDFAEEHLRTRGSILCKYFRGRDDRLFVARAKSLFTSVQLVKPKASRSESAEMYLLAQGNKQRKQEIR